MKLYDEDILTRQVLQWQGIHILHDERSSASQKVRLFLAIKHITWESHHVSIFKNEHLTPWFLGINPRGLLPVLVHDSAVHIESNDILVYLEEVFPDPPLIPKAMKTEIGRLLKHEDDLHMDLRNLSLRFVFAPPGPPKTEETLEVYATSGSHTVLGREDEASKEQIQYWRKYTANGGIPTEVVRTSAGRFKSTFDDFERRLGQHPYLLGDDLTAVDIAWFVYVGRLLLVAYPFSDLHPLLFAWFTKLSNQQPFKGEIEKTNAPWQGLATRRKQGQVERFGDIVRFPDASLSKI